MKNQITLNVVTYHYKYRELKIDLSINQISYIEKQFNYIFIHVCYGSKESILKQRKIIQDIYKEFNSVKYTFIQINESIIINVRFIFSIQHNECKLIDGTLLYISRGYLQSVHSLYYTMLG